MIEGLYWTLSVLRESIPVSVYGLVHSLNPLYSQHEKYTVHGIALYTSKISHDVENGRGFSTTSWTGGTHSNQVAGIWQETCTKHPPYTLVKLALYTVHACDIEAVGVTRNIVFHPRSPVKVQSVLHMVGLQWFTEVSHEYS